MKKTVLYLMCLAVAALSGCSVYLHDERLQKQTTAAIAAYKAANVSEAIKATIDAQAAFDKRMLESVVAEETALRDQELAELLTNGTAKSLDDKITARLKSLGGDGFVFGDDWTNGLLARDLARVPLGNQSRLVAVQARRYKELGGTGFESCEKPFALPAAASAALATAHRQLVASCVIRGTFAATATTAQQSLQSRVCGGGDGSLLQDTCSELSRIDNAIQDDQAAVATVKKAFADAKKKAENAARQATIDERVTAVLTVLSEDIAKADELVGRFGSASFKPSAALAAIEFRKTNLCDVLAAGANASCSGDTAPSDAAKDINKAIVAVIAGFTKISGRGVPDTEALSMALAYQTGLHEAAQKSLEGWSSRRALVESQQNALIREVEYLLHARVAMNGVSGALGAKECAQTGFAAVVAKKDCKAGKGIAQAMNAYSLAWAEGRTAARIAYTRESMLITTTNLRIAQANAKARDAVLNTALVQLDAFGQGGVSPHTIAEFLQAIGVGAIANGVN
jgi:hypothetical protein